MLYTFLLSCVANKSMQIIWNSTIRPKMYLRWPINSINYSNLVTYKEKVLFDEVKKGIFNYKERKKCFTTPVQKSPFLKSFITFVR